MNSSENADNRIPSTVYDETVSRLRQAGESHDAHAMIALLADDVVVRSPITQKIRFEGIEQARDLFTRVFDVIRDITFYEVVGAGTSTQVIFWTGTVSGTYLEEANLLKFDEHGRIVDMTVFMRAVPGLLQLLAALAPSLASRYGKPRAMFLRAQLTALSRLYRAAEPLVLALAGAGVPMTSKSSGAGARTTLGRG
jgi:ketosteroid isomerase-like protein